MKRIYLLLVLLLSFAVSLMVSSCGHNLVPEGEIEEGMPASLTIAVSTPVPQLITAKATDLQETHIESIALLFYKALEKDEPAKAVVKYDYNELESCEYISSSTGNYMYVLNLNHDEITSGYYNLYVIANYNTSAFGTVDFDELGKLTVDQLMDEIIENPYETKEVTESSLLLTGQYGKDDGSITIKPGENKFEDDLIHLRRITGKVNFTIKTADGVTFEPVSYDIHNLPTTCTLFERRGWQLKDGTVNNNTGTFASKYFRDIAEEFVDINDNQFNTESTFYFYMYENAQLAKNETDKYSGREQHVSADDQSFLNAPDNGTYVVINGRYTGPGTGGVGKVVGDVSYTIHLGDFSSSTGNYNNYTVRRNTKYHYIVTINGVSKIIAEAQADPDDDGYDYNDYDSGAEGELVNHVPEVTDLTLDSHYETVMICIPKSILSNYVSNGSRNNYSVIVRTPVDNEIYSYEDSHKPQDSYWIKFMKPLAKDRLPAYPGSDSEELVDVYGLVNDFVSVYVDYMEPQYFIEDDDYCYVAAFVDEYVYNDDTPLNMYVNADDRELTLTKGISVSADGKSVFIDAPVFSLKQHSIISSFNLDYNADDYNPFGMEYSEEYGYTTWDQDAVGLKYSEKDNSLSDGYSNFVTLVTTNPVRTVDGGIKWSDFFNYEDLGHFGEDAVPSSAFTEGDYSTTKGSYGRYQCLSRNRDENGDGNIDGDEIKWYTPAIYQIQDIWLGYETVPREARVDTLYVSSYNLPGYFTSSNHGHRVWYSDEGVSFSGYGGGTWIPKYPKIRCVRNLINYNGAPSLVSEYDSQSMIIDLSKLNEKSKRASGSQTDEYISHYRGEDADVLPDAIQVASANTSTGFTFAQMSSDNPALCNKYYNSETNGNGWRAPNEKELSVCVRYLSSALSNCKSRTIYKHLDGVSDTNYWYNGSQITVGSGTEAKPIRCVRDATPYLVK